MRPAGILLLLVVLGVPAAAQIRGGSLQLSGGGGIPRTKGAWTGLAYSHDLFAIRVRERTLLNFFAEGTVSVFTTPVTVLGTLSMGFEIPFGERFDLRGSVGASLMSRTTDRLGGHFQFLSKGGPGLRIRDRIRVGVFYAHISSADIYKPNAGNSYAGVDLLVDF